MHHTGQQDLPAAGLADRAVPLQAAFQIEKTLGDARRADLPGGLEGKTSRANLIVIQAVFCYGLEASRVVLEGWIVDAKFSGAKDVGKGVGPVRQRQKEGVVVAVSDRESPGMQVCDWACRWLYRW